MKRVWIRKTGRLTPREQHKHTPLTMQRYTTEFVATKRLGDYENGRASELGSVLWRPPTWNAGVVYMGSIFKATNLFVKFRCYCMEKRLNFNRKHNQNYLGLWTRYDFLFRALRFLTTSKRNYGMPFYLMVSSGKVYPTTDWQRLSSHYAAFVKQVLKGLIVYKLEVLTQNTTSCHNLL
jgi:hypothetical protein